MRVFVTGAIGFVGINVVRWLAGQGDEVIALYRTEPEPEALAFLAPVLERVQLVPGDVEDATALSSLMQEYRPEGVIHAAAMTPKLATERLLPYKILNINLMGTVRALDAAVASGVRRFVFVSSDGVYGGVSDPAQALTEETQPRGEGLYPIAKIASEAICRRYALMYGLETVSGRVGATYGPMERPTRSRLGMSAVCEMARATLEACELRVRGLEISRSWTHVADMAGALAALLHAPHTGHDIYNLSYGVPHKLSEVLEVFSRVEPRFRYRVVATDEEADVAYDLGAQRGAPSTARLREDIGFQPRFDLESGIRDYMAWVRGSKV